MPRKTQFPADENVQCEEFKPSSKYGILVHGKNFYTGFWTVPDFPRWHPIITGNINIYDWERLMTGTVDFGERSPLNALNGIVDSTKVEDETTEPREYVRLFFEDELRLYESGERKNGGYREVAKVWPGTKEVLPELKRAVERFADLSSDDTLTAIVIFSHGEDGSIEMGDSYLPYRNLLRDLDKIKGKKAVFVYACHSGSFLRTLRAHKQARNFAAIVSCEADNLSTTWNDRSLDDYLWKHFSQGGRYSDLRLETINGTNRNQHPAFHGQHPQMLKYFDVQLI